MLHRWVLLLIAASGCGRFGFDGPDDPREYPGFCATATFSNPPLSSFVDDFSVAPFTERWLAPDPCIAQGAGELVASPQTLQYCQAFTTGDYHLTCDAVTMHVPEVTSAQLRVQTFIYLSAEGYAGQMHVLYEAGGFGMAPGVTATYDAAADAWWRVREIDGEVIFDTAPDGLAWVERMRIPTEFPLDHAFVGVGAGVYQPVADPGQARFRCFNVPPPCN